LGPYYTVNARPSHTKCPLSTSECSRPSHWPVYLTKRLHHCTARCGLPQPHGPLASLSHRASISMCRLYHFAFDDQDTGRDLHSVNASGFYRPYTKRRRVARLAAKMSSVDWTNRLAMRGTSRTIGQSRICLSFPK